MEDIFDLWVKTGDIECVGTDLSQFPKLAVSEGPTAPDPAELSDSMFFQKKDEFPTLFSRG